MRTPEKWANKCNGVKCKFNWTSFFFFFCFLRDWLQVSKWAMWRPLVIKMNGWECFFVFFFFVLLACCLWNVVNENQINSTHVSTVAYSECERAPMVP